jgi:ribose transport system ATP-binding protein
MRSYLLFDPTRGIDVRTKRQIYPLVRELAQGGAGVLFYTSDLTEVPLACDRVAVIFGGRLIAILPADAGEEALMRSAYGLHGVPA